MVSIDVRTFTAQVECYKKLVFQLCYAFVHNDMDAEDLTQETFLAAYNRLDSFDGTNFKAWLMAIAANKCKSFLTNPRRKMQVISDEQLSEITEPSPNPEEQLLRRETQEQLLRCCSQLKEPYKTVATLYFCKGVKLSTYAKESGIPLRTLETQLYRAKKLLRILWKEEEDHAMQPSRRT